MLCAHLFLDRCAVHAIVSVSVSFPEYVACNVVEVKILTLGATSHEILHVIFAVSVSFPEYVACDVAEVRLDSTSATFRERTHGAVSTVLNFECNNACNVALFVGALTLMKRCFSCTICSK